MIYEIIGISQPGAKKLLADGTTVMETNWDQAAFSREIMVGGQ